VIVQNEHKKANLERKAEKLKSENARLNDEIVETIEAMAQLEREKAEARAVEDKRRAEELNKLKRANEELKVSGRYSANLE